MAELAVIGPPLTGKTTRLVERYRELVQRGLSVDKILCLSFFSANAESIRQALKTERQEFFPGVTTLQRFQTLLLWDHARAANLPARAREISPAARALVIRLRRGALPASSSDLASSSRQRRGHGWPA